MVGVLMVMVCKAEASTTTFAVPEIDPKSALIVACPADWPVAWPVKVMEAIVAAELLQVTTLLMFCMLPSL